MVTRVVCPVFIFRLVLVSINIQSLFLFYSWQVVKQHNWNSMITTKRASGCKIESQEMREKLNQCFIGARIKSLQELVTELKQFVTGRGALLQLLRD